MSIPNVSTRNLILPAQSDYFTKTKERLINRGNQPEMPILTIPELNQKIWGIKRREITIVAARTSMGKTALMNQIAWDLSDKGRKILYLTLEMDVHSMQERLFSLIFSVNNRDLITGKFKLSQQYQREWLEFERMVNERNFIYCDYIGKNWTDINNAIESLKERPDVVIIDHINEIASGPKDNRRHQIDDYLINLRRMCVHYGFATILGAQINRSGLNDQHKEPELYQLKESGKLEEAADLALLLYWGWKDNPENEKYKFKIRVAKNRNGDTGDLYVKFEPQYYKFSNYTPSSEEPGKDRHDNSKSYARNYRKTPTNAGWQE